MDMTLGMHRLRNVVIVAALASWSMVGAACGSDDVNVVNPGSGAAGQPCDSAAGERAGEARSSTSLVGSVAERSAKAEAARAAGAQPQSELPKASPRKGCDDSQRTGAEVSIESEGEDDPGPSPGGPTTTAG